MDVNHRNKIANIILWGIIIAFAIVFSAAALNRHAVFGTHGFDLGNVNQAVWQSAHGNLFAFTNMAPIENRLALHVEPILLAFVPFYWLGWGSPQLLLVAQAIIIALGALPMFLIARPKIGAWGGVAVSTAYLLYPALEAAVLFDFHAVALAPTFLLWGIYELEKNFRAEKNDYRGAAIALVLAMACKEDMGLVVAMLGLYVGISHKQWKVASAIFGVGMLWSLTAVFAIQPLFASEGNIHAARYAWLADVFSQPELLWAQLGQVGVGAYLWELFAPTGGLALLSPVTLLPMLPSLAINLLSTHALQWRAEEFHYAAPMAPFVFLATLATLAHFKSKVQSLKPKVQKPLFTIHYSLFIILLLSVSLIYHHYRGFTPLAMPFQWQSVSAHEELGETMASQIPAEVPLFAPLNLNPHVSSRAVLHQEFSALTNADWLWLDVTSLGNAGNVQTFVRDEVLPQHEIVWADDGYLLLKPPNTGFSFQPPIFNGDFLSFTRPVDITPQYSLDVNFGDALELLGFDLRFNRAENVRVTSYWRALKPLPANLSPMLYLLDVEGNPVGATSARDVSPTMIWLSPDQWQVGETIAVTFDDVTWESRLWEKYRLAMGVSIAADPWNVAARLSPSVTQSPFTTHFAADRTLIELARFSQVAGMQRGEPLARAMSKPIVSHRTNVDFGEQLRLVGYDVPQVSADGVRVQLVWQGLGAMRPDLTRFVHLVDAAGLRGQNDSIPDEGSYPTSVWVDGEFVPEKVFIPTDESLPAGDYILHIGFYNPADGQRLTGETGDHFELPFAVK